LASPAERNIYQEDDGKIQHESNTGIHEKSDKTEVIDLVHGHVRNLHEKSDSSVHKSADRRKVVERNHRVHLELGRGEQAFNHGETSSFEHDTHDGKDDTNENEFDLANRGNDDTNDNDRDIG